MHLEYLVLGASLATLLLSTVVWIDAQRTKRQVWRLLAWQQQQCRTIEQGGTVISGELNPQPTHDHLHVLTAQVVRARRQTPHGGSPNLN